MDVFARHTRFGLAVSVMPGKDELEGAKKWCTWITIRQIWITIRQILELEAAKFHN